MFNRMEEIIKAKTTNVKEYGSLNEQLREPKFICSCYEIMSLQRKGGHHIMYQRSQQFGRRTTKTLRTFGVNDTDTQVNIVTDH